MTCRIVYQESYDTLYSYHLVIVGHLMRIDDDYADYPIQSVLLFKVHNVTQDFSFY